MDARAAIETLARPPRATIASITPSGNTVVERVTAAILASFPEVSAHFSRTPVHGDHDPFPDGYDLEGMLGAAALLGHIHPSVIVWNGSKAGAIDFALDHDLVRRITALTGVPATTSILALDEILRADGVRRFGLVSPYDRKYQDRIVRAFAAAGYECVGASCAGLSDNLSFAAVEPARIAAMAREVAAAKPAVIVTFCTNFMAAPVVPAIEAEHGVPVYDSTVLPVWKALRMCGLDTQRARPWGRLFER